MSIYLGLVHYPVYNRNHETVASAVTTVDVHDIARLSRAYGVKRFFVVTPLTDQALLVKKIIAHWTTGYGSSYNMHRKEALELVSVVSSISEAVERIGKTEESAPLLIATSASIHKGNPVSFEELAGIISAGRTVFLLFGTAWGLEENIFLKADYVLEPVTCATGYRHISVRSAVAIIMDRLIQKSQHEAFA